MAASAVFIFAILYGKKLRKRSQSAYWALVEDNIAKGMAH